MVLVATKAIEAGSDLLLSYGALDNHTLLLDYGFMDPDNPFDNMVLSFDIEQLLVSDASFLACQTVSTQYTLCMVSMFIRVGEPCLLRTPP